MAVSIGGVQERVGASRLEHPFPKHASILRKVLQSLHLSLYCHILSQYQETRPGAIYECHAWCTMSRMSQFLCCHLLFPPIENTAAYLYRISFI
jgi:hypothetical protein